MGVVRLFGVNLPIPVGTMVWPVEIKMELDRDNNNNSDNEGHENGSASYNSQNGSNASSVEFESMEDDFSEDLNALPEDEELLSGGSM